MTDFYTGDLAANRAQLLDAFNKAKANIAQQRQSTLQRYGYSANGTLDPMNQYGQYQQIEHAFNQGTQRENQDYATNTGRENEDYATNAARLAQQRAQTEQQSGLHATLDANGNPVGVALTDNNPNGSYQRMMSDEAQQLMASKDAQASSGLGSTGLGARGLANLQAGLSGNRSDFRNQLLDTMIGQHNQQQDLNTGHGRTLADLLTNHNRTVADLGWTHGTDQQNMGLDLQDALHGLDMQDYANQTGYANGNNDAMLQAILAQLQNDPGTTGPTGAPAGAPAVGPNPGAILTGLINAPPTLPPYNPGQTQLPPYNPGAIRGRRGGPLGI